MGELRETIESWYCDCPRGKAMVLLDDITLRIIRIVPDDTLRISVEHYPESHYNE